MYRCFIGELAGSATHGRAEVETRAVRIVGLAALLGRNAGVVRLGAAHADIVVARVLVAVLDELERPSELVVAPTIIEEGIAGGGPKKAVMRDDVSGPVQDEGGVRLSVGEGGHCYAP